MDSLIQLILAHKEDALAAWKMVLAHKVAAGILMFMTSATGASIFARLLNAIPMDPIFAALTAAADGVSRAGNLSVFRLIYQPLEDWFEIFIMGAAQAICKGLKLDTQVTTAQESAPTPSQINPPPLPAPAAPVEPDPQPRFPLQ